MNTFFDSIKKLGAYALIIFLTVIMGGYAFVDRNATDAAKNFFVSGGGPGTFAGHTITWSLYTYYYSRCKAQQSRFEAQFGTMDKSSPMFARFSAESCVKRTVKSLFALREIAAELSLEIGTDSVKADIVKQALDATKAQQVIHEDEKLTAQQMYRRILSQVPLEARMLEKAARFTQGLTSQPVVVPDDVILQKKLPEHISLNVSIVRWENTALLESLKDKIKPDESKIKAKYTKEQKKLKKEQKKPYSQERPYLIQRMKAEVARKELGEIKKRLSALKSGFELNEVSTITGLPIKNLPSIRLHGLGKVKLKSGSMNLATASFYKSLRMNVKSAYSTGPHQDAGYTVYVKINKVMVTKSQRVIKIDSKEQKKLATELGRELSNALLEESGKRGALKLEVDLQGKG